MSNLAILGAGLAGLSAAYHLGKGYTLFEKENQVGGVCRSFKRSDFTFDATGHVLHFRTQEVARLVKELLQGQWLECHRSAWVYTQQKCIPYPFQVYFTELDSPIREECLDGFLAARQHITKEPIETFEQWLLSKFGKGIARHFLIPYNTKLWGIPPGELGLDGVQKYIPAPSVEEILNGTPHSLGYNQKFYYPLRGGIQEVSLALQQLITEPIQLGYEVEKINLHQKKIRFTNGDEFRYGQVWSTIPLPELGKRIEPLPDDIRQLFNQLKWVSVCSFHFGVRKLIEREKHWIYFADPQFPFYRVVLPSNYAPHLAPKGKGTLQVEVALPSDRPMKPLSEIRSSVIQGLQLAGLLEEKSQIEVEEVHVVRYGYAVFIPGWQSIVKTITDFLAEHHIQLVGRYASWEYMSLEDCILAGKEAHMLYFIP